jgi:YrbI family 3-deoxy-D-manno-octulosonate 8-phosphate phosphatase
MAKELKLNNVKLIVYDFDGVMTDNTAIIDENGKESVSINRSDGLAVIYIKKMNIPQIILTAETNKVVAHRARKLGIDVIQTEKSKILSLKDYLEKNKIDKENTIYIGNEINDIECMQYVGYSLCPADACQKVKKIAGKVLQTGGGRGAVREFYDILMGIA